MVATVVVVVVVVYAELATTVPRLPLALHCSKRLFHMREWLSNASVGNEPGHQVRRFLSVVDAATQIG